MKKSILLLSAGLLAGWVVLSSRSGGPAAMGLGDKTGSPVSSGKCSDCHSGGNYAGTADVVLKDSQGNVLANNEYVPGDSYTLEVNISITSGSPQGYGFQLVALDASNNQAGTFSSPSTNTQISSSSSRDYFEHSAILSTTTQTVTWTAPASGTGDVSFYFNTLAVNSNGGTSGDSQIAFGSKTFSESGVTSTKMSSSSNALKIYPVPAKNTITIENVYPGSVEIYNISGQKVKTCNILKNSSATLNIEDLPSGIFFLKQNDHILKFIKQ